MTTLEMSRIMTNGCTSVELLSLDLVDPRLPVVSGNIQLTEIVATPTLGRADLLFISNQLIIADIPILPSINIYTVLFDQLDTTHMTRPSSHIKQTSLQIVRDGGLLAPARYKG